MTDVDGLLDDLTLDEKAALTAGRGWWSTVAIERLGIPEVRMTDGPNGVRGASHRPEPATCVPCGSALGATWDTELVSRVGRVVGSEARLRRCRVLLAPTANLCRSPLGGRNFECYSEDPMLAGSMAAAFVRGAQGAGVIAVVKHFAGNECETDRMTADSMIDNRTLREVYLQPFERAVNQGALGVMTAYNRLNGEFCSENEELLGILRQEWGFDGFVVTDWGAAGHTVAALRAGLDLEMPGPGRFYGRKVADAIRSEQVDEERVDRAAGTLLRVFGRVGALSDEPWESPEDEAMHGAVAREAAAAAAVLLKNEGALLPLDPGKLRTLAVVGPNADRAEIMGGGSAALTPRYRVSPLRALRKLVGDGVEILHEPGAEPSWHIPALDSTTTTAPEGEPGVLVETFHGHDWTGPVIDRSIRPSTDLTFLDGSRPDEFSVRITARYTPDRGGPHTFSLAQVGLSRVFADGEVILDGTNPPLPVGSTFLGLGSAEVTTRLDLQRGRPVEIIVEYNNRGTGGLAGVRVGCLPPSIPDLLDRAVSIAGRADAVVVVVGTDGHWESEGYDRSTMNLPGGQDELIERVQNANPNTVVVVNAGTVVDMPWADQVAAILQTWFGGQEMATALADILFGHSEPGGRLPLTIPERLEHTPAYGNFPAENGRIRYSEGLLVGHRWYDTRLLPTRFPFGHGLSYSEFEIGAPELSSPTFTPGERLIVDVPVTNTGKRVGSEVVQCYVMPPPARLSRPTRELHAFGKIHLAPGKTGTVRLSLDARAFSYWDDGDERTRKILPSPAWVGAGSTPRTSEGWIVEAGDYQLQIGRSSADIAHSLSINVRPRTAPGR